MIYTDNLPLDTIERDAWQRGDLLVARLAALAQDKEEEATKEGDRQYTLERIEALITEANWRTGKKAELRTLIDKIRDELLEQT